MQITADACNLIRTPASIIKQSIATRTGGLDPSPLSLSMKEVKWRIHHSKIEFTILNRLNLHEGKSPNPCMIKAAR